MESKLQPPVDEEDDMFEYLQKQREGLPPRTAEEVEEDIQFFINHPLNAKKVTPEMLELPEY